MSRYTSSMYRALDPAAGRLELPDQSLDFVKELDERYGITLFELDDNGDHGSLNVYLDRGPADFVSLQLTLVPGSWPPQENVYPLQRLQPTTTQVKVPPG